MSKKSTVVVSFLIIFIGISIIISMLYVSKLKMPAEDVYFNPKALSTARKSYKNITDLEEDTYPPSPDMVVKLYFDGYTLIYGNMLADDTLIPEILQKQRLLLSDELLALNSLEEQEQAVKNGLEILKEKNFYFTSTSVETTVYDKRKTDKGYVCVSQTGNDFSKYYWNYYVQQDDNGYWKITHWKLADEFFREIN